MPAVTQLIPNFLGGVSRQIDDKKLLGQVTECINGYPDPTYGLLKRPGMKHTNVLKKADGTAFTKTELDGAVWFFIEREGENSYIGAIKGTNIFVWTTATGEFCTVTNNATSYLTNNATYHFRSVQDVTVITNKTVNTAMQANGTFTSNSVATIHLSSLVSTYVYKVKIAGIEFSATAENDTTYDDMLSYTSTDIDTSHHLIDAIKAGIEAQHTANNAAFAGKWYLESYSTSIVIKRTVGTNQVLTDNSTPTATPAAFTIEVKGGPTNTSIEVFQDSVTNISKLPIESFHNHNVQIVNSSSADDDYYVKFVAFNGSRGAGYWQETVSRTASPGLDASKMPHQLSNTGPTAFTFAAIPYSARQTGDDVTSPIPSFIGSTIQSTFFYGNRFGVLSEDNVFLGTANDSFNFFVKSATVQTESDPIDLNAASIRPVKLFEVLPSSQGLLLFSARQQFQVYASDSNVLTPSTSIIKDLSNYEIDTNIAPVDIGSTSAFITKVPGYSKVFTMQLRDVDQGPVVTDISKVVLEWIPDSINSLAVSPQNSVIMLVDNSTPYLYLFKYFNAGKENLFEAWTKWKLPGNIQTADIINDSVYVISQQENEYTLGRIILDEIPTGSAIAGDSSIIGNTCLDMATRPVKPHTSVNAVVYDSTNDLTKIYVPYTPFAQTKGVMLLTVPTADLGTAAEVDADSGFYLEATERTENSTNYRYFEVKGDYSSYADGIVVGYNYDFETTLPKLYYKRDPNTSDYTATLTISRVTFSVGRTGPILFKIKSDGSDEWKNIEYVTDANSYKADSSPVKSEHNFTIPIHQRNTNFELKVTSNFPYPVSLVSMTWEGQYSPRFYRRA
jgi:hypothetical protein|tara:strand:+ start:700 stop:3231 length:2532 start_codon:yes stop_codon:yes gene_type:complete